MLLTISLATYITCPETKDSTLGKQLRARKLAEEGGGYTAVADRCVGQG